MDEKKEIRNYNCRVSAGEENRLKDMPSYLTHLPMAYRSKKLLNVGH